MVEFESPKIPSASEVLKLIRDPEGQLSHLQPLILDAQQFEGYLKPVETSSVWQSVFPREQIKSFRSALGDYVLSLSRPDEPISCHFIYEPGQDFQQDFFLEASNVVLVSDGLAISLASLAPIPGWSFNIDLFPEYSFKDWINKWSSAYSLQSTSISTIFNNLGISALLHELGHAWSDHLHLDPNTNLQQRIRVLPPGIYPSRASQDLAGIQETNFSERVANIMAKTLSRHIVNSGFTVDGKPFAFDNRDSQIGLESYDGPVFDFVVANTDQPAEYFASRKYRTGKY
jgi:hypothetical protein